QSMRIWPSCVVAVSRTSSLSKASISLALGSLMHGTFRTVEDVYYQHLDGHIDPRTWRGIEAVMREVNAQPGVQAWWRLRSHWFDEEFAKFINHQQQTATRHDN